MYVGKDKRGVRGRGERVLVEEGVEEVFGVVGIVGSKECEEEREEIGRVALGVVEIVRGNIGDGCGVSLVVEFVVVWCLGVKREMIGSCVLRMVLKIVFGSVVIGRRGLVVRCGEGWMEGEIILVEVIEERMGVSGFGGGMRCWGWFIVV